MKVYLAGWDVFRHNAREAMQASEVLCRQSGITPLNPLDNELDATQELPRLRRAINRGNLAMIASADAVLANLNPFRGFEPDSGTVFECGYAVALGIPVFGYANDRRPLIERYREVDTEVREEDGLFYDANGLLIENLGNGHNLMLEENLTLVEGPVEQALQALISALNPPTIPR